VPKRLVQPEDLLRFVFVSDPQVSPDGKTVLFAKKTIGEKNEYRTQLVSVDGEGHLKEWTQAEQHASHGRWSPDGAQIAFLSKRDGSKAQIHVLKTAGGEAGPVTEMPEGDFASFRWSPDGSRIAFAFRKRDPLWTEVAQKKREEKGLSTPARIANTAFYRFDGEGFFLDQRYAVYVVDVASKASRKVYSKCPWGRYSYEWSPDGKRLAITRSYQKNLWRDPEDDRILILDLKGKVKELKGQSQGEKRVLRWSPDGKWIAYLGIADPLDHRAMSDTELFVALATGGKPLRLTSETGYDLDTGTLSDMGDLGGEFLEWLSDSSGLYLRIGWHGEGQIARVGLEGKFEMLTKGRHVLSPVSISRNGRSIACTISNPKMPAEVAVVEPKKKKDTLKILTKLNEEVMRDFNTAEPEELHLKAADGYPVHAWVIWPKVGKAKRTPAVLEIHGGPQAQYGWTYFHEFQVLAAAGYAVVYSNPRGSKGYGADHVRAIAGSWGGKDWQDIEAVRDWMKASPRIDLKRMGVMGGSYGGYLTNWVVGHTSDFRAAITDRCVSNLLAKALNSDYPYYPGTHWQGSGYGSLESNADLWRDSPLAYFDKVQTPMLIIHSEGDLRCNIEQGEQVFSALQERGIPSRFVRYPVTTSHGMSRGGPPDLRIHRLREILSWWRKYLS
jgi:dipeptidyl aminopeptidase/acylaminoacyl peptidase